MIHEYILSKETNNQIRQNLMTHKLDAILLLREDNKPILGLVFSAPGLSANGLVITFITGSNFREEAYALEDKSSVEKYIDAPAINLTRVMREQLEVALSGIVIESIDVRDHETLPKTEVTFSGYSKNKRAICTIGKSTVVSDVRSLSTVRKTRSILSIFNRMQPVENGTGHNVS